MKFSTIALLSLPAVASAFVPLNPFPSTGTTTSSSTSLSLSATAAAVVTGPQGKAASSREEDMALTLQIILDHEARSATVSSDQLLQQTEEIASMDEEELGDVDISIPYDAPALLAYEKSGYEGEYETFRAAYEAEAVMLVKSKQPIDISIPYDAPARKAYAESDYLGEYETFKAAYEAEAVALVKSKQPIDISIPYDAAAKLAYENSDKSMSFEEFEPKYLEEAVALVVSKQPQKEGKAPEAAPAAADAVDISIDYAAPARLAFEKSGYKGDFETYRAAYEAEAVMLVRSKQPIDISIPYDAAAKLAYEGSDKSVSFDEFEAKYLEEAVALVVSKKK